MAIIGTVILSNGTSAINMVTDIIPQKNLVIPQKIEYPEIRKAFGSGVFQLGDIVIVQLSVIDKDGKDKTLKDSSFKITLDNYVSDPSREVLGVFYMKFVDSIKPPEPDIIAEEITE